MKILSWNIQSGLGCDGIRDINRIARYILDANLPEVVCLQEVSRNIANYSSPGQEDQLVLLTSLLPDYSYYWGKGVSHVNDKGVIEEFGNLTLTKERALQERVHLLPYPPGDGFQQMQRVAVEVIVAFAASNLRVINTHLAYHHRLERNLQLDYLTNLQKWAEKSYLNPPIIKEGAYGHHLNTPFTLMCGDFNFIPSDYEYTYLMRNGWYDAWLTKGNTESKHQPTCGLFDIDLWQEGPHCRDYFWMSESCPWSVVEVCADQECNYSDHQPILITLKA